MDNKLNGSSQIWADGYSFMEVTETLLMALGMRSNDSESIEPALGHGEPAVGSLRPTQDAEEDC